MLLRRGLCWFLSHSLRSDSSEQHFPRPVTLSGLMRTKVYISVFLWLSLKSMYLPLFLLSVIQQTLGDNNIGFLRKAAQFPATQFGSVLVYFRLPQYTSPSARSLSHVGLLHLRLGLVHLLPVWGCPNAGSPHTEYLGHHRGPGAWRIRHRGQCSPLWKRDHQPIAPDALVSPWNRALPQFHWRCGGLPLCGSVYGSEDWHRSLPPFLWNGLAQAQVVCEGWGSSDVCCILVFYV